jgi:hypothetical protein
MSFCDISFNRTGGSVTDVLNKEGRESALYPQLVSYVQQDPQTVYDSKKEYFDTLVDQGKLVDKSDSELSLGLYSIAYNSGVSEQEFMDRINRDSNLSVFGVGGQQVISKPVFDSKTVASTIFELVPNITEEQIKTIYDNYVNLMNRQREGKAMPYESFRMLMDKYQVYKYKDTYIFGQYDPKTSTFITRVNSSPSSKELLAEAIPSLVEKGLDFISFVPKDYADKLVRSGYTSSANAFDYNFKGEEMKKFAVASNPNVFKKVFNKAFDKVSSKEIEDYNEAFDLKYQPVEINADLIKKAGRELSSVLETYLNQFGIVVKDIDLIKDKLGIDELGFADLLSKIAYIKDKKDLPPIAGEFIAYMMQYNPLVQDIIKELSQTTQYKSLDKSQYFKIIGELISQDLQNKLEGKYNKSLISKIKDLIKRFFDLFKSTPIDKINTNIGIISNSILQQNKKLITSSLYKPGAYGKPTKLVSVEEALKSDKFGASIIYKLSKQGFILTGSTALSEQGTILRPDENPLHDIDWVSPFNRKETEDKFLESYPDAIKVRDIYGDGYVTDSYLIAPDGYSIVNYKADDFGGKIIINSYDVADKNGNVVGTYRLQKQEGSNQSEEMVTGIEGKVIDFFSYDDYGSKNKNKPFNFQSKEGTVIQLANWKDTFKAKLDFARYKDIWDYNRFIPTENIPFYAKEQKQTFKQKAAPNSTEMFLKDTVEKGLSKENQLLAKRLSSIPGFKNVTVEVANIPQYVMYNKAENKIQVSQVAMETVDPIAFEKAILNTVMESIADNMLTTNRNALRSNQKFYGYISDMVKDLERRMPQEMKDMMNQPTLEGKAAAFISQYMSNPELREWSNKRIGDKKNFWNQLSNFVATKLFDKRILEASVYDYLSNLDNVQMTVAPAINKEGKPIPINVSLQNFKEDANSLLDNYGSRISESESNVKPNVSMSDLIANVKALNAYYGGNVASLLVSEKQSKIKVDFSKAEKLMRENKKNFLEKNKKSNKLEFSVENKTRIVDSIPGLEYMSEQEKDIAEEILKSGEFQIFCGL